MWRLAVLDKHGAAVYSGSFDSPGDLGQFVENTLGLFLLEGADHYVATDGDRRVAYAASDAATCLAVTKSRCVANR